MQPTYIVINNNNSNNDCNMNKGVYLKFGDTIVFVADSIEEFMDYVLQLSTMAEELQSASTALTMRHHV